MYSHHKPIRKSELLRMVLALIKEYGQAKSWPHDSEIFDGEGYAVMQHLSARRECCTLCNDWHHRSAPNRPSPASRSTFPPEQQILLLFAPMERGSGLRNIGAPGQVSLRARGTWKIHGCGVRSERWTAGDD